MYVFYLVVQFAFINAIKCKINFNFEKLRSCIHNVCIMREKNQVPSFKFVFQNNVFTQRLNNCKKQKERLCAIGLNIFVPIYIGENFKVKCGGMRRIP